MPLFGYALGERVSRHKLKEGVHFVVLHKIKGCTTARDELLATGDRASLRLLGNITSACIEAVIR